MKKILLSLLFIGLLIAAFKLGQHAEQTQLVNEAQNTARNLYALREGSLINGEPGHNLQHPVRFLGYIAYSGVEPPMIVFPAFFAATSEDRNTKDSDMLLFAIKPKASSDEIITVNIQGTRRIQNEPMKDIILSQGSYVAEYLEAQESK